MTIQKVYDLYQIPSPLRKHMLRVAALSQILIENWEGKPLDTSSIVLACLLHDMANIIKFDLSKPLFKDEIDKIASWKKIQKEVIEKYGSDIHKATLMIAQEAGAPLRVLTLIKNLEWSNVQKLLREKDFNSCIGIYCDMRIGPHGILLLQERLDNLSSRNTRFNPSSVQHTAHALEKLIQSHSKIDVNAITENKLEPKFGDLLKIDIQKITS